MLDDKGFLVLPLTKDAGFFFSHFFHSLLAVFVILQLGGCFSDVILSPFSLLSFLCSLSLFEMCN